MSSDATQTLYEHVKQDILAFKETANNGGIRKFGLFQPKYEAGELLLGKIPYQRLGSEVKNTVTDGDFWHSKFSLVYITNYRAILMGNWGKIVQQWRWEDMNDVAYYKVSYHTLPRIAVQFVGIKPASQALYYAPPPKASFVDSSPVQHSISQDPDFARMLIHEMKYKAALLLSKGSGFDEWLDSGNLENELGELLANFDAALFNQREIVL